ncbi:MAG: PilZ domain-containing protein [Candidatus Sulfotelmatobacter sp.]
MSVDDIGDGASYLSALKRSISPQAAGTAPARAIGSKSPAENQAGPEKRRSPRYRCQGSAHLRDAESGVSTWATFTDISLHGCYVEASATYRIGTAIALKIDVNGFRVETRGEVRVAYPGLGMGIFFTTMSDEDRERLRELLKSLSQPSVILSGGIPTPAPKVSRADSLATIKDPRAVVQAMVNFFEDRQILSREEFFRILRKNQ